MNLWEHPGRGRWTRLDPDPPPEPEPEQKVINMSICMWCDTHQGPYPDSDPDSLAMTVPVPKVENGVKVGIAYTVERHKCGGCVRDERDLAERRRAISAGADDASRKLGEATTRAFSGDVSRETSAPRHREDW